MIRYLDGLGRPLQTIQWQGRPGKKDIVQVNEYDGFGREVKKYLPYAEQSEQQLIDHFGRSKSDLGTSGNNIRGVSKINPFGRVYHQNASKSFGELNKYTGI